MEQKGVKVNGNGFYEANLLFLEEWEIAFEGQTRSLTIPRSASKGEGEVMGYHSQGSRR